MINSRLYKTAIIGISSSLIRLLFFLARFPHTYHYRIVAWGLFGD